MLQKVNAITIYGAASSRIDPVYFEAAAKLGKMLAENSITCINGGGIKGLMAAVSEAVLINGGKVCGIIPEFMYEKGWLHPDIQDIILTSDMHGRKKLMAEKSDACIALPGGIGTLDELMEIITWKQLGLYNKPIVILNTAGYYDPLLLMLENAEKENFTHSSMIAWQVADTPEEALDYILNRVEPEEVIRLHTVL